MASKYWLKLYHEMTHDPKMIRLSDRLFRRTVQTFLLAGELDQDGALPSLDDMSIILRVDMEQLETELIELSTVGILSMEDGEWIVTKFAERQEPISGKERVRQHRDRKRKKKYYGNEDVTTCYTDTDKDIDKDIDVDKRKRKPPPLPQTPKEAEEDIDIILFNRITDRMPGISDYRLVIEMMNYFKEKIGSDTEVMIYLTPYWQAWDNRKYSPNNYAWLTEWAVNADIPAVKVKGEQQDSVMAALDRRKRQADD